MGRIYKSPNLYEMTVTRYMKGYVLDSSRKIEVHSSALFSFDNRYRYHLMRQWDTTRPSLYWCMLNPSTADALKDDPTIHRCVRTALRLGFGSIEVVNLFAFRATNPKELARMPIDTAVGPRNAFALEETLELAADGGDGIVCAWGTNRLTRTQVLPFVRKALAFEARLLCLGVSAQGDPMHPLARMKLSGKLVRWSPPEERIARRVL